MRFCVFPVKNVVDTHSSREMIEVTQELFLICISFFTGVGMYFSPFASKLMWSFVSFLSEMFDVFFCLPLNVFLILFCVWFSAFFSPFC